MQYCGIRKEILRNANVSRIKRLEGDTNLVPSEYKSRVSLFNFSICGCSKNSKMSHPRCMYINNRCRHQSITKQYLKRCLIKDDSNYMFRPIEAIIRSSSESMVVVLCKIGMVMSRWSDLIIRDVCYMLLLWEHQSYKALPPYFRMKT